MTKDPFQNSVDSPMAPAEYCFAIAPDDSVDLPHATKALYIGEAGDVVLVAVRGTNPVTFANLAAGTILDVRARAVRASGTTAGNIVGLA